MWSAGQCGFLHLTFQEYLAGLHAAREGKARELVQHIGKSWWREVILVAVAVGAREFALRFFTELLQTDAVAKEGAFVDQCLDEARYAVLEPFIAALTAKGVKPERQVEILRRLRQAQHDDLTAVCRKLGQAPELDLAVLAQEILTRALVAKITAAAEAGRFAGKTLPRVDTELPRPAAAPLELRVDPRTGIAFILIPAGEFDMGAAQSQWGDERPVHRVRLTKPFLLGKYPVTNAEYERFLKANPEVKPPPYWNNSQFNDPQQPVVTVSWEDAQAFCQWAGGRLPTEAEWEYACRAGNPGQYCFGDDETKLGDYAWYSKNSGGRTRPVGQKQPNDWGLYDVHGNVWEWCQDWFGNYPKGPATDPTGPKTGNSRVLRGGSWFYHPTYLRSAFRNPHTPVGRSNRNGFRCVGVVGSSP